MKNTALITGISGQDAAYLAHLLLERSYRVIGTTRRSSVNNLGRLEELGILDDVEVCVMDLMEGSNIRRVLRKYQPDEIYNLAAQSFVASSFEVPIYTTMVDGVAPLTILDTIRESLPEVKFYQASTSELYGKVVETPQNENTPFYPRSPYAFAKQMAHWATINFRESFGMHAKSGILFNHESPLRGKEFVTRKITLGLSQIAQGELDCLYLGNLDAKRDWGYAKEYVEGMWRINTHDKAEEFVLATGQTHSVRFFVECCARFAGMELEWSGKGINEKGIDKATGKAVVSVSEEFYRPAEVDLLLGDPSKAEKVLGWKPTTNVEQLAELMMTADMDRVSSGRFYF